VLSNLVCNSADLSKHYSNVSLQSFKKIFATKELLLIVSKLEENTSALLNQGEAVQVVKLGQISQVSILALFLILATSCTCHNPNPAS
jgi:hypothetical protein